MQVEAKLGWNVFRLDTESHIAIDHEVCQARCTTRPCLHVCPAGLYTLDTEGLVRVDFEGCLECGTCYVVCPHQALRWVYPRAGFGVHYRFG
jgi:ferredoxin like protein